MSNSSRSCERTNADCQRHLMQVEQDRGRMEEMISLVAHDALQPLTVVRGHVELLQDSLAHGDLERIGRSLRAIHVSTTRLESIIQDLVDSARPSVVHRRLEPVALAEFIPEILGRLSLAFDVSRVHEVEVEKSVLVLADPNRLERILGNLLSNAVKHGEPGTPITVRVEARDSEVVVSVSNWGPEISPVDLPHVFERGYRAAGVPRAGGLGLGLYIAHLLVQSHGGRIWVENEPGKGVTFHFTAHRATTASVRAAEEAQQRSA